MLVSLLTKAGLFNCIPQDEKNIKTLSKSKTRFPEQV